LRERQQVSQQGEVLEYLNAVPWHCSSVRVKVCQIVGVTRQSVLYTQADDWINTHADGLQKKKKKNPSFFLENLQEEIQKIIYSIRFK
jgi:hypothetical protein